MYISIVIPTYNRLPILQKCLLALEKQQFNHELISQYEIVLIDDGSTDETLTWIAENQSQLTHVKIFQQDHQGAAAARNLGIKKAEGDTIIFIDSDLVVTENFLQAHSNALVRGREKLGSDLAEGEALRDLAEGEALRDRLFTYGAVINTCNFDNPTSEPYKITDSSAAYFATGNVAISKYWLEKAGMFDTQFQLYGWEDLELGVRLKKFGLKLIKCPEAVGYHWHPPFNLEQIPNLIDKEIQRGRMGVIFYQKHPTFAVKMMIQMTILHRILCGVLCLG